MDVNLRDSINNEKTVNKKNLKEIISYSSLFLDPFYIQGFL